MQDFLNTADLESGDRPLDPATISTWAAERGVVEAADLVRLVTARELLRDWISAGGDIPVALGEVIDAADLRLAVTDGQLGVRSETSFGSALAPVFDAVRTGVSNGTWARFKACERDRCRWVFYDHSKNASSHWCSASICGMREKSRRAYARRRGDSP